MRRIKLLIILLCVITFSNGYAQRVRGIYKTSDDFQNEKLSFDNNCTSKIKVKLNDFLSKPYITIKQSDTIIKLFKNNIFGYKNCDNQVFRFKAKHELLLLNSGEQIYIYKHLTNKPPPGSRVNITNYYFSIGATGSVQKLTIKNLKTAFPDNKNFQALIDANFTYNTDLAGFETESKSYKINSLLNASLK